MGPDGICLCAIRAGLVTANPAFQARELAYVLEQSGAVALFLVKEFRGNPMGQIGTEVTKTIKGIREITDMNTDTFYAKGSRRPSLPNVQPSSAAMIQYTSGTTGFSKGRGAEPSRVGQ